MNEAALAKENHNTLLRIIHKRDIEIANLTKDIETLQKLVDVSSRLIENLNEQQELNKRWWRRE